MHGFLALYNALDSTTSTSAKVRVLEAFFRDAPAADAGWALALMTGRRPRRIVSAAALVRWVRELSGLPDWLYDECAIAVGDTAETIALVLEGTRETYHARHANTHTTRSNSGSPTRVDSHQLDQHQLDPQFELAQWMEERILPLRGLDAREQRDRVVSWLRASDRQTTFLLCKLLTGGLRVGASRTLAVRGLAAALAIDPDVAAHRVMGNWNPGAPFIESLRNATTHNPNRTGIADLHVQESQPFPFYLASPIDHASAANVQTQLGDISAFHIEWKWDGIRAQLIRRNGRVTIWSRGEELLTDRFPEITDAARRLPDGSVLDGELLAWRGNQPLGFHSLQRRIARQDVTASIRARVPCIFMAYDLLEYQAIDIRTHPLHDRRVTLERLFTLVRERIGDGLMQRIRLSELLSPETWEDAAFLRDSSRVRGVEGLMLKSRTGPYRTGRVKGEWWKWKVDPFTADLVLISAQAGHGRRAGLLTDYTFAAWDNGSLVAVTKAYSGLTKAEINELDAWLRAHTRDRFGPVRTVDAELVFELAFEGAALSSRNRSGLALRFPRIARWRRDKPAREADTLDSLRTLIHAQSKAQGHTNPENPGLFDDLL